MEKNKPQADYKKDISDLQNGVAWPMPDGNKGYPGSGLQPGFSQAQALADNLTSNATVHEKIR